MLKKFTSNRIKNEVLPEVSGPITAYKTDAKIDIPSQERDWCPKLQYPKNTFDNADW